MYNSSHTLLCRLLLKYIVMFCHVIGGEAMRHLEQTNDAIQVKKYDHLIFIQIRGSISLFEIDRKTHKHADYIIFILVAYRYIAAITDNVFTHIIIGYSLNCSKPNRNCFTMKPDRVGCINANGQILIESIVHVHHHLSYKRALYTGYAYTVTRTGRLCIFVSLHTSSYMVH